MTLITGSPLEKRWDTLGMGFNIRDTRYPTSTRARRSSYEHHLPDMAPRSDCTVFTHADIAPRNIMIDEQNKVTGILDWEWAGWYPDYWEYAQIPRPAFWGNWSIWMDRTAPQRWDISGINAARRVLF